MKTFTNKKMKFLNLLLIVVPLCHLSFKNIVSDKALISSYLSESLDIEWFSSIWDNKNCISMEGKKVESDNKMFIVSRWDNDSLYFFIRVIDNDLRSYQIYQDHPLLFLDDMVEILIDTRDIKDSCWDENDIVYHINLLGVKKDDRGTKECKSDPAWNGNASIYIKLLGTLNDTIDIDTGYLVTIAFPWDEIKRKPAKGLRMGLNFANGDNDGKGRKLFDWAAAVPLRSPNVFGELYLK